MKKSKIKFQSYDGYKLDGTFQDAAHEEIAVVLFVHGITSDRDELGFHSDMAVYLAKQGVASFRFDYRFHGVREKSLENLSLAGVINDIDSAYEAMKGKAMFTSKAFVVGTSFGGGLVAYWADHFNKTEIKKIILNAPVIDYEDDVLVRNNLKINGSLSPKAIKQLNTKGYVNSSGIHFGRNLINELKYINGIEALKRLGSKVWIFHGKDDDDVPLSSTLKFKTNQTGLTIVPNVGHGFGIDIDEDLDHPETKAIHQKIYQDVWNLFKKEI